MWGQKWLNHSEVVPADSSPKETIWSWWLGLSEMGWLEVRDQMSLQVIRATLASFHHSILSWKLQHLTDSVIHLFWQLFRVWLPNGWVCMVSHKAADIWLKWFPDIRYWGWRIKASLLTQKDIWKMEDKSHLCWNLLSGDVSSCCSMFYLLNLPSG